MTDKQENARDHISQDRNETQDPRLRDRDKTDTLSIFFVRDKTLYVLKPSRDRDVSTETTSLRTDLVQFDEDLSGDLDMVLLDVLDWDDDPLVETDVGEDLPGAGSNARHRTRLTLRWLGRVVDHGVHGVLKIARAGRIQAGLRLAGAACHRRLRVPPSTPRSSSRIQRMVVAWRSGNTFHPNNEVTLRRARLVLWWVTACGQVNHLGM